MLPSSIPQIFSKRSETLRGHKVQSKSDSQEYMEAKFLSKIHEFKISPDDF